MQLIKPDGVAKLIIITTAPGDMVWFSVGWQCLLLAKSNVRGQRLLVATSNVRSHAFKLFTQAACLCCPYRAPYEAMPYNTSHGQPACAVHKDRRWRCRESNPVPLACKASALPYELHPLFATSANASHCACSLTCFPRLCSVPLHDQASVARSAVDFAASAPVVHTLALHPLALLAAYVPPAPASNWLLFF